MAGHAAVVNGLDGRLQLGESPRAAVVFWGEQELLQNRDAGDARAAWSHLSDLGEKFLFNR